MTDDPIVAEIRQARHVHAAQFNNDLSSIVADIRRLERESGRKYVNSASWPLEASSPREAGDNVHAQAELEHEEEEVGK